MRVFNGHSDLLTAIHYHKIKGVKNSFRNNFYDNFKKGNVGGSIFVLWTDEAHVNERLIWTEEMLKSTSAFFEEERDVIKQVLSFEDYKIGLTENKINIVLGMEGLAHIGKDLGLIEKYYYENGLRHASLTWNEENSLAKGPHFTGGLSRYGKEAIKIMEKLGILIDVSHLNDDGFWDVIGIANKPIIASHSNARTLANVKRNLEDSQLKEIARNGGVVGLNAAGDFISNNKENRTPNGLVDQLEYLVEKMGIDHVAFGFDFMEFLPEEAMGTMKPEPGTSSTVFGLEDESEIPEFIQLIKKRGYSNDDIEKIAYKNFERILKEYLK